MAVEQLPPSLGGGVSVKRPSIARSAIMLLRGGLPLAFALGGLAGVADADVAVCGSDHL